MQSNKDLNLFLTETYTTKFSLTQGQNRTQRHCT